MEVYLWHTPGVGLRMQSVWAWYPATRLQVICSDFASLCDIEIKQWKHSLYLYFRCMCVHVSSSSSFYFPCFPCKSVPYIFLTEVHVQYMYGENFFFYLRVIRLSVAFLALTTAKDNSKISDYGCESVSAWLVVSISCFSFLFLFFLFYFWVWFSCSFGRFPPVCTYCATSYVLFCSLSSISWLGTCLPWHVDVQKLTIPISVLCLR